MTTSSKCSPRSVFVPACMHSPVSNPPLPHLPPTSTSSLPVSLCQAKGKPGSSISVSKRLFNHASKACFFVTFSTKQMKSLLCCFTIIVCSCMCLCAINPVQWVCAANPVHEEFTGLAQSPLAALGMSSQVHGKKETRRGSLRCCATCQALFFPQKHHIMA